MLLVKRLFYSISVFVFLTPAFLLCLSVATAYLSPTKLHVLAFAGYAFPLFWFFNLMTLIVLLIRKSWYTLIPLFAFLISWSHLGNTIRIKGSPLVEKTELQNPISIMSYNTRMFDFYNHSGRGDAPEPVFNYILSKAPDIIAFQEYFTSMRRDAYTPTAITARFRRYPYRHIEYLRTHAGFTGYGMAIFSKYPIVNSGAFRFDNSLNMAIYADVNVNGQLVRIFNCHLESIGIQSQDFDVLDSLDFRLSSRQREGLLNISRKLTRAFNSRSEQAESLARHFENSPYPVIVCGDFNDTPVSYVYRTMRGDMKDAFRESGVGFGGTYNGSLPSFRIDYIFHDQKFQSYNFYRGALDYSDHYPIMTTIDLKK